MILTAIYLSAIAIIRRQRPIKLLIQMFGKNTVMKVWFWCRKKRGADNRQKFIERTKKYFFFKQFSNFIGVGFTRIEINSPAKFPLCAFISPDKQTVVAVAINTSGEAQKISFENNFNSTSSEAYQTDKNRNCEPVSVRSAIPPKSVRTFLFKR